MNVTVPDFTESERELVADLLRVQTDHESQSKGISSGATAADLA